MEPIDITVEILKGIRSDLHEVRDEVRQTNARLDVHEKALAKLIVEVRGVGERIDNVLTGAHKAEHDELRARVRRLEELAERP